MANDNREARIPYSILTRIVDLLIDIEQTDEIVDLYLYCRGKLLQSDLGLKYADNDKETIAIHQRNSKALKNLMIRLKNPDNYK